MSTDDRGWSDEEQLVQYLAEFGFSRNEARMYLAALGRLEPATELGDGAVRDQHVLDAVQSAGGIDDAAALEEQAHAARRSARR